MRDEQWFEAFYAHHVRAVSGYVARRTQDGAEDVVSETFITAWRRRADIPEDRAAAWLYRTAAHHMAHARRSTARHTRIVDKVSALPETPAPDIADDVTDDMVSDLAAQRVRKAIDSLPPGDQEILRLWAWENLSPKDIALVLGLPGVHVRMKLSRARKKLRKKLDELPPNSLSAPVAARRSA